MYTEKTNAPKLANPGVIPHMVSIEKKLFAIVTSWERNPADEELFGELYSLIFRVIKANIFNSLHLGVRDLLSLSSLKRREEVRVQDQETLVNRLADIFTTGDDSQRERIHNAIADIFTRRSSVRA